MRVLIYSWPFAPTIGGLERLTEMTACRLTEAGHEVTVVTDTLDPEGRAPGLPFRVERRPGLRRLARLVGEADVIHLNTFSPSLTLMALARRRPVTWQHIDFDTLTPRGICHAYGEPCVFSPRRCYSCLRQDHSRARTLSSIGSLFAKRAAVHLVRFNLLSTSYAQQRMRLPRPRFLSFGIDLGRFAPRARRPHTGLKVFFTARHVPAKGCDVLIRALARCRDAGLDFKARVGGDGPHRESSERLAASLGLGGRTEFIGFQSEEGLLKELRAADVVVVPTVQDEIGQFVAFEAMACECAVVASNIGALPEHVDGAGLLFPPGDDEALAGCLQALAGDPELRRRLARAGRRRVEVEFNTKTMGESYLRLFEEVGR